MKFSSNRRVFLSTANSPRRRLGLGALVAAVCAMHAAAAGASVVQPAGLDRGDPYRLVFITHGATDPLSSDVQVYNDFVTAEAAKIGSIVRNLDTNWYAIVSSTSVNARTNTKTDPTPAGLNGTPLYLVDGVTRIARNYDDLWDANIEAPVGLSQFGALPAGGIHPLFAWTGSREDGTAYVGFQPFTVGTGSVVGGFGTSTDHYWTSASLVGVSPGRNGGHLYAVSDVLFAVPEPATGTLLAASLLFAGASHWRFRAAAFQS